MSEVFLSLMFFSAGRFRAGKNWDIAEKINKGQRHQVSVLLPPADAQQHQPRLQQRVWDIQVRYQPGHTLHSCMIFKMMFNYERHQCCWLIDKCSMDSGFLISHQVGGYKCKNFKGIFKISFAVVNANKLQKNKFWFSCFTKQPNRSWQQKSKSVWLKEDEQQPGNPNVLLINGLYKT